ncbi:MAG: transcriptional regulator [Thermobacillus sp. ZCTH02-B1]|uniref:AraC family transcriptional regulator n=1 Tax=Thermobacillus sp. ZCTH02-B1 TaxID=1858795 RepID=UPI000B57550A|nr:AraC family transcriptional regulator [Thermobacillus sp. ZCTH02-B1]OUM95213.1 MAG: transcriptional regulator [Thermobacillus sp. ZCTH02-B1]
MKVHRRIVMPFEQLRRLPLAVESVGINPEQERIVRPDGYPYYHWLQTLSGSGRITAEGRTRTLPAGSGVLLFPGVKHSYEADEGGWETAYLTFGGAAAESILAAAGVHRSMFCSWPPEAEVGRLITAMVERLETGGDVFGIEASSAAYHFLLALTRYATNQPGRKKSDPDRLEKLRKAVEWMESRISDPTVGVEQIADVLRLSGRRVTGLFREAFGQPPYAYFIQLRLRKAKELLTGSSPLSVREVAQRVGFRDASHFIATFRRHVGMTPEQFRRLH